MEVDIDRKRIALSMKPERKPEQEQPKKEKQKPQKKQDKKINKKKPPAPPKKNQPFGDTLDIKLTFGS